MSSDEAVGNFGPGDSGPVATRLIIRHMRLARLVFTGFAVLHFLLLGLVAFSLLRTVIGSRLRWEVAGDFLGLYSTLLAWPLVMGLIFTLLAMCTWLESWELSATNLTHYGLFRTKRIEFDELRILSWWPFNRMIVLRSARYRIPLFLDSMTPPIRLRVIEQLQRTIPASKQHNWPRFCQRFAWPLWQRVHHPIEEVPMPNLITEAEALQLWQQTH